MYEFPGVYIRREDHPAHPFTLEDRGNGDPNLCSQRFKGNRGTWICNRPRNQHLEVAGEPPRESKSDRAIRNAVERERSTPTFEEQLASIVESSGSISDLFENEESMLQKAKRHFNVAEKLKAKYDSLPEDEATDNLWRNYNDEINLSRLASQIAGEEDEIMHHRFERERDMRRRDLR